MSNPSSQPTPAAAAAVPVTPPPITQVSPTDDKSIAKFAEVITSAFHDAPLMPAFIVEQDNLQPPFPRDLPYARRLEHFQNGIASLIKHGAHAVYAGDDYSAVAIWCGPEYTGPGFGESRKYTSSLTVELGEKLTAIENRILALDPQPTQNGGGGVVGTIGNSNKETVGPVKLRPFWLLQFLARNPDVDTVAGGISAVMRPFLQRAAQEKVPAWLDAISLRGVRIYEHYGFRVVEEVKVGEGRLRASGWPAENGDGEGVSVWVMIYDQHLT